VRADHLRTLSLFELRMLPSHAIESLDVPSVATIERLAGAAFVVTSDAISPYVEPRSTARLAEWAQSAADNLSTRRPLPLSPPPASATSETAMESNARLARSGIEQLKSEVQHVASAGH
jgi:hypothetical protein